MDVKLFAAMFSDRHFTDCKKMKYKYPDDIDEFLSLLAELFYKPLPLPDFDGGSLVFIPERSLADQNAFRLLMTPRTGAYGIKAAEDEIVASASIENIDFSRESVRSILNGYAPKDEQENRILGVKRGLDFIADPANKITEENLFRLYDMTVGEFLPAGDRPRGGDFYRDDKVFIVGDRIEHSGLDHKKVPAYMRALIDFINADDGINDLVKAAIVHFYIAYVHPYFDGNGRMARLLHLWYLIRRGFRSALFIPFSSGIDKSRKAYYDAFTAVEENKKYSGVTDVTPFIIYFAENVYDKIAGASPAQDTLSAYGSALRAGKITKKEDELWRFVLSRYGTDEFSTKQLEKDFGSAAYATIRGFVMKFTELGLLDSVRYGQRVRYKAAG